jgi:hypothetical protein
MHPGRLGAIDGAIEPNQNIATFNDALSRLEGRLTYLYASGGRYWFDNHPNLIRTVEDRASRLDDRAVDDNLRKRLAALQRERADFRAIHPCLVSADIPDDDSVRLVVLSPTETHAARKSESAAMSAAAEILDRRGNTPRLFKNMLVFVAADADTLPSLEQEERRYLAWDSVLADKRALNLDQHQQEQAQQSRDRANETVGLRLNEAYSWVLVPTQAEATGSVALVATRIPGTESSSVRASRKLRSDEQLITRWSPQLLRLELDKHLWADEPHLGLKKLWDYLAKYPYLPRLRDSEVLVDTVREGVRREELFAYATGEHNGTYSGLIFGEASGAIYFDSASLVVKPDVARSHSTRVQRPVTGAPTLLDASTPTTHVAGAISPTRFHATISLDPGRVGLEASRIAEEVISHLTGLLGTDVEVVIEIEARHNAGGFPPTVVRNVTENARTLKFKDAGFEDD